MMAAEREREQERAGIVDLVLAARRVRRQHGGDHDQREDAGRQVDVEDPAPAQVVDEESADQRADDGGDAEHRAEEALIAPALARRDQVADHGDGDDDQSAAADPFQRAEQR